MEPMSSPKRAELVDSLNLEVRKLIAGTILFNEKVAARVGLNSTDLQCLHLLQLQGAATPGELARWAGLTTGGATVVVDRLENAGYLRREPNPNDRRSTIIRPVAAKLKKLEANYQAQGDALQRVIAAFPDPHLRLILNFLKEVNAAGAAVSEAMASQA
jgi:DNA-binding MarR family transcriptional regulator